MEFQLQTAMKSSKAAPETQIIGERIGGGRRPALRFVLALCAWEFWWPIFAVFEIYWPAIHGPFLLDDSGLPYTAGGVDPALRAWVNGLRPLLMLSFWLNYQRAGNADTFGYHLVNVVLHCSQRRLDFPRGPQSAGVGARREMAARSCSPFFAAALFLLHPLQTESVTYIVSRSETLSVFWLLAAFVVFLYRTGDAIYTLRSLAILALFGAAVLTKEHTAVFPALLLLTDFYWNPGFSFSGVVRNWRLYIPIAVGGALAVAFVLRVLSTGPSAGFGIKEFTWYQYFFTECRVIWDYLRMFVLPIGQNVDPDVPISKTVFDHGAVVGLLALIAVSVAAWIYRRRFQLASYGWFVFLILLAPTSSFVPIWDPMAERRLYLPFIGLLFIVADFLSRWKTSKTTLATALSIILIIEAAATYQRNQLWASATSLWKDSVAGSPNKYRPRFQLAFAYFLAGDSGDAIQQFEKTAELGKPTFDLLLDSGLAYDAAGKLDQALEKLQAAAAMEQNAHVYQTIGYVYGKMGKYPEALAALATSQKLDAGFPMTYYTRGNVFEEEGNRAEAAAEYRHALALDPQLGLARDALLRVGQ